MCFGAQKNCLIETILLSTHNICFGREIRKIIFNYTLLFGGPESHCFVFLSKALYPLLSTGSQEDASRHDLKKC